MLPFAGTVLVRVGQKVTPSEVIAEAEIPSQFHYVDVMRSLGLGNPSQAEKLINRKVGDQVDKNDILVETGGVFSKVIRSPKAGKILSTRGGQILVETATSKVNVSAGFSGTVVETIKDRGAVLETNGVLVQGSWGNGKVGYGQLQIEIEQVESELAAASLGINSRGMVLCAERCSDAHVLELAGNLALGGLILGSISPDLIEQAEKISFPIIAIEGFVKSGINDYAKRLITTNAGREVAINAVKWDRWMGERPEIIISLPADGDAYRTIVEVSPGQLARVHTPPYNGQLAIIMKKMDGMSTLPNRVRTTAVGVKFLSNEKAVIPLANLELIDLENRYLGTTEQGGENGTN
jgi:hypothetical protein